MFVTISLLFVSCGKKEEKKAVDTSLKLRETGDIVLTFMMWGDPYEKTAVFKVLQEFQKDYPKIGLKVIHVDSLSFRDKLQSMYAGGTPPDVFYLHVDSFYGFASKGLLYPLDDLIKEENYDLSDFYPMLLNAFKFGGNLYGIPKDWTSFVLYYNMDLFDKEGIPYPSEKTTWDDIVKAGQKLTKDFNGDGIIDQYGIVLETWADWYYNWIKQNGGEIFTDKGEWVFAKGKYLTANAEAIQFLADLISKYKIAPDIATSKQLGNYESFMAQRAAMCIYGRWAQLKFKEIDKFRWNYAVLPHKVQRACVFVTVALSISSETKYPKESWELVKYLTSTKGQIFTAESGLAIPSRISLVSSDHYLKAPDVIKNQPHLAKNSVNEDPFIQQMPYAVLCPANAYWIEVRQKLDEQLEDVFLGNRDAKSVILSLNSVVNDILSSKGQAAVQGSEE